MRFSVVLDFRVVDPTSYYGTERVIEAVEYTLSSGVYRFYDSEKSLVGEFNASHVVCVEVQPR